jgi:L-alanine-DL-glutamate epimerase-like enolase superfamily enzyme
MKITDVEAIELRLPRVEEKTAGTQDTLLVRVKTDAGLVGLGEVDSSPRVAKAVIEAPVSHTIARRLREILLGADPLEPELLWRKMLQGTIYFGRTGAAIHAMAGVDMALWDLKGKALGMPVFKLLGGAFHRSIRAYASTLFGATPAETETIGRRLVDQGFTAVKFGWEPLGPDERLDVELVAHARKGVGDERLLFIDAGCAWDSRTAIRRERLFRPFHLGWLEEPLHPDDLAGYATLAVATETPLAAGEGEATCGEFLRLMDEGRVDVIQIDPARVGLSEAIRIARLAEDRKKRVVNHSYKTRISVAASLHLLAAVAEAWVLEYCVEESPLLTDLVRERFPLVDGFVTVPEAPGLGVTLHEPTIDRYRV